MTRTVDEWIGKTDDTPVPRRVRVRQFERDGGRCQCGCGILIRPGDVWETDHKISISNGGPNRESNLRTLLKKHHKAKTREDQAEKSMVYRKRAKHIGIRKRSRFPASRDSKWKKRVGGSVVLR